jgi:hypothetical protein
MMREIFEMQETKKMKNRREFIKDGLRTVVLGGLAFAGLSLGRRKVSSSGDETSCTLDLPCSICSKLPGCREPEAMDTKQISRESRRPHFSRNREIK